MKLFLVLTAICLCPSFALADQSETVCSRYGRLALRVSEGCAAHLSLACGDDRYSDPDPQKPHHRMFNRWGLYEYYRFRACAAVQGLLIDGE